MRSIVKFTRKNGSHAGSILLHNVSALAQNWATNAAIDKRLVTQVSKLFRPRHRFDNGDVT
jgi:hypothetical protein